MINCILFLALFICSGWATKSQNLHFVGGSPFSGNDLSYQAFVYKYDQDSAKLDQIAGLTQKEGMHIEFINYYKTHGVLFMMESSMYNTNEAYFTVIETTHPSEPKKIKLPPCALFESSFLTIPNKGDFYCLHLSCDSTGKNFTRLLGINRNLKQSNLSPEDFRHAYIAGSSLATKNEDFLIVLSNPSDGKLRIPKTVDATKRPLFPYVLPDSLAVGQEELLNVVINNEDAAVLSINTNKVYPKKDALGQSSIVVYDKKNKKWFRYELKGSSLTMKAFGSWITGAVTDVNSYRADDKKKVRLNKVSPGAKDRRPGMTDQHDQNAFGPPQDLRFDMFNSYYPGILYLFNVQTRQYIEWNTGQGDSEVLLLEGNTVYYRINTEIYKTQIKQNGQLAKPVLLLKDEKVPDIHWAFFSAN